MQPEKILTMPGGPDKNLMPGHGRQQKAFVTPAVQGGCSPDRVKIIDAGMLHRTHDKLAKALGVAGTGYVHGFGDVQNGDVGAVVSETLSPMDAVAVRLDRNGGVICIGRAGVVAIEEHMFLAARKAEKKLQSSMAIVEKTVSELQGERTQAPTQPELDLRAIAISTLEIMQSKAAAAAATADPEAKAARAQEGAAAFSTFQARVELLREGVTKVQSQEKRRVGSGAGGGFTVELPLLSRERSPRPCADDALGGPAPVSVEAAVQGADGSAGGGAALVDHKVQEFAAARRTEKTTYTRAVMKRGGLALIVGLLTRVLDESCIFFGLFKQGNPVDWTLKMLGVFLVNVGILVLIACHYTDDEAGLDEYFGVRRRVTVGCIMAVTGGVYAVFRWPCYAAAMLIGMSMAAGVMRVSTACPSYVLLWWVGHAGKLIFDSGGVPFFAMAGGLNLLGAVATAAWWCVRRRAANIKPTDAFYRVFYAFQFTEGLTILAVGFTGRPVEMAIGVCLIAPVLVISVIGRDNFFQHFARRFERGRAEHDGAFMAELLEGRSVAVGDVWWVHHGRDDATFPPFDPRRNWTKECVVEVAENAFFAGTDRGPLSRVSTMLRTFSRGRFAGPPASPASAGDAGIDGDMRSRPTFTAPGSGMLLRERGVRGRGWRIPLASRNVPSQELLGMARAHLRCIDWTSITIEIMTGAICGSQSSDLPANSWYALSRPVRPGETVDYFMSHSWHDDAQLKFQKLTELAETFNKKHHRYPTFWLDKVCIDQDNIADGLRVLPVNVMACARMLMLCGSTYPTRLWCAWELCTLFSFMRAAQALERVELVPLDSDPTCDVLTRLTDFDVRDAHCYDPNEESRLFEVINAVSRDRFNARIRALSVACRAGSMGSDEWEARLRLKPAAGIAAVAATVVVAALAAVARGAVGLIEMAGLL